MPTADAAPVRFADPPLLVAALIAARRTRDKTLEHVVRDELAAAGISITFAPAAPCLSPQQGPRRRGKESDQ